MDFKEGRHFVLHLLKFVYQITGRFLPNDMQNLLDEFPIDAESNFTVNITKAIMVFVQEYLDFGGVVADISSQEFKEVLDSVTLHENFLEFLGYYTLKCVTESRDHPSVPSIFLETVTKFLEKIKNLKDVYIDDYWRELDQAAARIVVRDLEIYKGKCDSLRDPCFEIDIVSEKEFIIDIMNYIFDLLRAPSDVKLKHETNLQYVLTSNIEKALHITVNHHAERFKLLRDYEPINTYCRNLTIKGYSDEGFLEYCVCCARQAASDYIIDNKTEAPKNALDNLVKVLQRAKEDGKFTTLDQMDEAATMLIRTDSERKQQIRNRSGSSCLKRKLEIGEDPNMPEEKSKKEVR